MTGSALSIALQIAAQFSGIPLMQVPNLPNLGVDVRQEIQDLHPGRDGQQLRVMTRAFEPKTIALTFDDGPHPAKTLALLKVLKQLDVKATFFLVGKMVDRNPWVVRQELADGHEVGNHTYDHVNLDNLTPLQVSYEYSACSDAIDRATGFRPKFCRPPGGRFDTRVVQAASDEGMWTVLWTDDPGDFALPNARILVQRIANQMSNGGILLLHDGIQETIDVLPTVVQDLRKKGYRFVTCSELLAQQCKVTTAYERRTAASHAFVLAPRRKPEGDSKRPAR